MVTTLCCSVMLFDLAHDCSLVCIVKSAVKDRASVDQFLGQFLKIFGIDCVSSLHL